VAGGQFLRLRLSQNPSSGRGEEFPRPYPLFGQVSKKLSRWFDGHGNICSLTVQSPAYVRFRRALDHGNATEALWAAGEVEFVGLAEALDLTLLLAEGDSGEPTGSLSAGRALRPTAKPRAMCRGSCRLGRVRVREGPAAPRPQPDPAKTPSGWTSPDSKRCRTGRPRGSSRSPGMASRRFRRRRSLHVQSRR
jgi:hypothetical protein